MGFSQFKYERPDFQKMKNQLEILIEKVSSSESFTEQFNYVEEFHKIQNHIKSLSTLSDIRYTINTEDSFYSEEKDYWNEIHPLYEEIFNGYRVVLFKSKFKKELEEKLGKQFFKLAEFEIKSFSSEIIPDLQEENRLATEYEALVASAKIPFRGEIYNISGMTPFLLSADRDTRKEASEAKFKFYEEKEKEIDEIFDKLVKLRAAIAQKLGFKNFVELGYIRMQRTDYNPEMVENFRKQVREYIVPLSRKLYEKQRERLGLESLEYYDEKFQFLDGNPTPKGDSQWIIENTKKMYRELSPETDEFFKFMMGYDLMDLVTKPGKAPGGYCTYLPDYEAPFIFSNFNGTSDDIDVMTHEAGHAFAAYLSRWIKTPNLDPTLESAEIHSMSMEFFTWPWMENFFLEDTAKYKYMHLESAIKFIPYGVVVDAFQHKIYENPNLTPEERKEIWRELEKEYLPHKNYSQCNFLERGCWWFQQLHIFLDPFYYIDYTLAQICALQFWKRMHENREEAWESYLEISKVGGMYSFLELLKIGDLISPFQKQCVPSIIPIIESELHELEKKL